VTLVDDARDLVANPRGRRGHTAGADRDDQLAVTGAMHRRNRTCAEVGRVDHVDKKRLRPRIGGDAGVDVGPVRRRNHEVHGRELRRVVLGASQGDA
jgi:hypothetical protein